MYTLTAISWWERAAHLYTQCMCVYAMPRNGAAGQSPNLPFAIEVGFGTNAAGNWGHKRSDLFK